MPYFVYFLLTSSNTFYIGQTKDLEKRLAAHRNKKGAKYMKYHKSFKLVYMEELPTRSAALRREYELKKLSRSEKEELIKERDTKSHL